MDAAGVGSVSRLHSLACITAHLGVKSRSEVVWMLLKDGRVFTPFVTDEFIWRSSLQRLEPFGKVVCLYECVKVLTQLRVGLVEVADTRSGL